MLFCNPLVRLEGKIKGIIFDCDGVLFDSREVNVRYYNLARKMYNLPPLSREEEDYVHMHSVYESFKRILPEKLWPEIEEIRKKIDYSTLYPYLKLEKGLFDLLLCLQKKDIKRAINTNRTDTMLPILEVFKLRHFFHPVVTANLLSRTKPHPESVFYILEKWRLSAKEVAYIGDSVLDEECARRAGVHFWSYKNPCLKAEMFIPDFYTLKQFLLLKENKKC